MTVYPTTPAMAALRTLRKGAWWSVLHADLQTAAITLAGPMADLSETWSAVQAALAAYHRRADADAWHDLQDALRTFDAAVTAFLGPSGWEH